MPTKELRAKRKFMKEQGMDNILPKRSKKRRSARSLATGASAGAKAGRRRKK